MTNGHWPWSTFHCQLIICTIWAHLPAALCLVFRAGRSEESSVADNRPKQRVNMGSHTRSSLTYKHKYKHKTQIQAHDTNTARQSTARQRVTVVPTLGLPSPPALLLQRHLVSHFALFSLPTFSNQVQCLISHIQRVFHLDPSPRSLTLKLSKGFLDFLTKYHICVYYIYPWPPAGENQ